MLGGYIYIVFFSTPVVYRRLLFFRPPSTSPWPRLFSPAVYITIDRSIVEGSGLLGIVPACVC